MQRADNIIFVGRFQPFHNAHKQIIDNALERAKKRVIILIGSYHSPRTPKNPWSFQERLHMIRRCYPDTGDIELDIRPIRDYRYNDTYWISSVQNTVANLVGDKETVNIIGHFKDDTSYYLNFFGNWELQAEPSYFNGLSATDLRNAFFLPDAGSWTDEVPSEVRTYLLEQFENQAYRRCYMNIRESLQFLIDYKAQWKDLPFPITFNTVDAVIVKSGHVLIVKRGRNPGKGQYALPGGFLDPNEDHFTSCMREVYEETKIDVPHVVLKNSCRDLEGKKFDHPRRDPRGRVVTTAYHFDLTEKKVKLSPLPKVKGSDDAELALWLPFNDLIRNEENFFNDHLHIIQHFIGLGG